MLLSLCAALCELRDADSLEGVRNWSTRVLGEAHEALQHDTTTSRGSGGAPSEELMLPWIQPLLLEAQGRYEEAVALYQQVP